MMAPPVSAAILSAVSLRPVGVGSHVTSGRLTWRCGTFYGACFPGIHQNLNNIRQIPTFSSDALNFLCTTCLDWLHLTLELLLLFVHGAPSLCYLHTVSSRDIIK